MDSLIFVGKSAVHLAPLPFTPENPLLVHSVDPNSRGSLLQESNVLIFAKTQVIETHLLSKLNIL